MSALQEMVGIGAPAVAGHAQVIGQRHVGGGFDHGLGGKLVAHGHGLVPADRQRHSPGIHGRRP
jgi:hypothetical protein